MVGYDVTVTFTNGKTLGIKSEDDLTEKLLEGLRDESATVLQFKRERHSILVPKKKILFVEVEERDVR